MNTPTVPNLDFSQAVDIPSPSQAQPAQAARATTGAASTPQLDFSQAVNIGADGTSKPANVAGQGTVDQGGDYLPNPDKLIGEAAKSLPDVAVGAVKGLGQTINAISKTIQAIPFGIGKYIIPTQGTTAATAMETPTNPAQKVGVGVEGLAEWMVTAELGGEAVKLLSAPEKLSEMAKAARFLVDHPKAAQIIANTAMGTAQPLAHGASLGEAAISGGVAGATSGLIEGAGAAKEALSPVTKDIAGVAVPVRSAVENPSLVNKVAEFAANKPALQEFDVMRTQPAARKVIATLAADAFKTNIEPIQNQLIQSTVDAFKEATEARAAGRAYAQGVSIADLPRSERSMSFNVDDYPNIAHAEKLQHALSDAINSTGDFAGASALVKTQLKPFYDAADEFGYNKYAEQADAAWRRGDVEAGDIAKAAKDAAFEKAHGTDLSNPVNAAYAAVDDIDRINKVMNSTIRNTPATFAKRVTNNHTINDPGIIDGAALRKAVRDLSKDGSFGRAHIPEESVRQLDKLGALLEQSKVVPGSTKGTYSGTKALASGGAGAGVAVELAQLIGAGMGATTIAPAVVGGSAAAYATNRFLGHLMVNPEALNYTVKAARTLSSRVIAPAVASGVTHFFNSNTGEVQPISPEPRLPTEGVQ